MPRLRGNINVHIGVESTQCSPNQGAITNNLIIASHLFTQNVTWRYLNELHRDNI